MTKKCLRKTGDGITVCVAACDCDDSENAFYKVEDPTNGYKCVSCADGVGITDAIDKAWKGTDGCPQCTEPEAAGVTTCTECDANLYLKVDLEKTSCIASEACTNGFFPTTDKDDNKKACVKCNESGKGGVADCNECMPRTDDPTKVKCTACSGNKKLSLDGLDCYDCTVNNYASCDEHGACTKCDPAHILSGSNCVERKCNTENCKECANPETAREACTECISAHYLTPTSQCIDSCSEIGNYYGATEEQKATCKECTVANCRECKNAGTCKACNDGFYKNGGGCNLCEM